MHDIQRERAHFDALYSPVLILPWITIWNSLIRNNHIRLICSYLYVLVVEKNPRANFSEIAKTVEEKWMQLDEEETEKYEEMGRKDEER